MKSFPPLLEKAIRGLWIAHYFVFLFVAGSFINLPSFLAWLYILIIQGGKLLRTLAVEGVFAKKNDLPDDVIAKKIVLLISDILRPVLWVWTSVEVVLERYKYSTFILTLFFVTTGMDILFYVVGQFLTVRTKELRSSEEPEQ